MRVIKSRIPRTTVPVLDGGFTANFVNYRAVVPEAVAAILLMSSDFFTDAGPVGDAVKNAKVLVVRDKGLGDVLLTTPLIRKLVNEKGASVDVLTEDVYRCLFDGNPHVNETFALNGMTHDAEAVLFARYDVVLDLRLVVENAEAMGDTAHRADAFAAYADFDLTEVERRPDVFLLDFERERASRYRSVFLSEESGRKGVVGYVWASSTSNRNWSNPTHDAVLAEIEAAGYGVLLIGDRSQVLEIDLPSCFREEDSHIIDLMGHLTLREAVAVMSHCDVIVTPDTGLFHVAAALDVPTMAYFGAFPVAERKAHKQLCVINMTSICPLAPCRSYRCFNRDENAQARCLVVHEGAVATGIGRLIESSTKSKAKPKREKPHVEPNVGNAVGGAEPNGDAQAPDTGFGDRGRAGQPDPKLEHGPAPNGAVPDPAAYGESA